MYVMNMSSNNKFFCNCNLLNYINVHSHIHLTHVSQNFSVTLEAVSYTHLILWERHHSIQDFFERDFNIISLLNVIAILTIRY